MSYRRKDIGICGYSGTPERQGYLLLILGAIVLAFMGLRSQSLRPALPGLPLRWDIGPRLAMSSALSSISPKRLLPVGLLVLFARRSFLFFVVIGFAWLGLVTYSALATHATVNTAIAAIERTGSWKMEVRSDTKAELEAVEKRLEVLVSTEAATADKVARRGTCS